MVVPVRLLPKSMSGGEGFLDTVGLRTFFWGGRWGGGLGFPNEIVDFGGHRLKSKPNEQLFADARYLSSSWLLC